MSTYTDLHNKLKETLNVDYKTRDTNQEVHFKNERNEYWGTLKGTIAVEGATISSSRIIDPFIEGGIIHNAKLSSDEFGVIDLGQVQTELESMSSFVGEVAEALKDETSARVADDKYLSSAIADSQTCISGIVEQLEDLSNAISAEAIARDEAISAVSSYIIEELGEEAEIRQKKDDWLRDQISATSSYTLETIDNLSNELLSALESDKHFKIKAIADDDKILRAQDWTVNTLTSFTISDGEVKIGGTTSAIGKILPCELGDEFIDFKVYKTIPASIAIALDPGSTYSLKLGIAKTSKPGYAIVFNKVGEKLNGRVFSESEQYYDIFAKGMVVGTASSCKPEGGTGDIKEGLLKIVAPGSLSVFDYEWNFNDTTLSSVEFVHEGLNKISYVGSNKFLFERNLTEQLFLNLENILSGSKTFGQLYQKDTELADDELVSASFRVSTYGAIALTREEGFTKNIKLDGKLCNVSCDASDVKAAVLDINELHVQNAYKSSEDSGISVVLSSDENKLIEDLGTDSTPWLDLTEARMHSEYKKAYPLSWTAEKKYEFHEHVDDNNYIDLALDVEKMEVEISYAYETDGTYTHKTVEIINEPFIWNDEPFVPVAKSQALDLTFETGSQKETIPDDSFIGSAVYHSAPSISYDLEVEKQDEPRVKIAIPDKPEGSSISRVLDFVFKIYSKTFDEVEIVFTDKDGEKPICYFEDRQRVVKIPTNKFSTLRLKEVRGDVFLVIDYNQNNQEAKIKALREDLDQLSGEVSATSSLIEAQIELSVGDLQAQILSNDADIADLYKQIAGGLTYRDDLSLDVETQAGYEAKVLSNLFYNNFWAKHQDGHLTPEEIKSIRLRNGFYYLAKAQDKIKRFDYEGVLIENADLIIIKDNTFLSALDASKVNVVDVFDADAVHKEELSAVSSWLSTQIYETSSAICLSVSEMSSAAALSAEAISAFMREDLSAKIFSLSNELNETSSYILDDVIEPLSTAVALSASAMSALVEKVSADLSADIDDVSATVKFLLSVDRETMNYKGPLPYYYDTSLAPTNQRLSAFIAGNMGIHKDGCLKLGDFFKISAEQSALYDANDEKVWFGAEDFFVINKNLKLDEVKIADIDIFRNAEAETKELSIQLTAQINATSSFLSGAIDANTDLISALSAEVSAISSATCLSAYEISAQLINLSNETSAISSYLEDEISTISSDLEVLSGSVKTISADHEQRLLSTEETAVATSAFIDEHYKQTFISVDREHDVDITTDNLVLTDLSGSSTAPHVHQKYYMTFENGTIALKPIK